MIRGGLVAVLLTASLLGACALPFGSSPSPSPSLEASPTASPTETPEPTPTPTPEPGSVPHYLPGQVVAANADSLRIRTQPTTSARILIALALGTEVVIVVGPVSADGYGWYLVTDPSPSDPVIPEGWVAAGVTPEPFLKESSTPPLTDVFPAGWSFTGNAEYGPIRIADEHYAIRWVASPVAPATSCTFAVDLTPGSGSPVPAIRTSVGSAPTPGSLYEDFFAAHPELRGDLFVSVSTDCAWSLAFQRTATII